MAGKQFSLVHTPLGEMVKKQCFPSNFSFTTIENICIQVFIRVPAFVSPFMFAFLRLCWKPILAEE